MTSDSWWLLVYVGTLGLVLVAAGIRREPTALRGRSLFLLTVVFAVLWSATLMVQMRRPTPFAVVVVGVALLVTFALRGRWLVARATPPIVDESIANSARRLLLVCEGEPGSRRVVCGAYALDVRATPFGAIGTFVVLPSVPRERKLELFRKFLGKHYRSAMPLPKFRM